jgi:hypothetical protein
MRLIASNRIHADVRLLVLAAVVLLARPSGEVMADDLLGLYVGGAIGQSLVDATTQWRWGCRSAVQIRLVGRARRVRTLQRSRRKSKFVVGRSHLDFPLICALLHWVLRTM